MRTIVAAVLAAVTTVVLLDVVEVWLANQAEWRRRQAETDDIDREFGELVDYDGLAHLVARPVWDTAGHPAHHHAIHRFDRDGRGHCTCGATRLHPGGIWT